MTARWVGLLLMLFTWPAAGEPALQPDERNTIRIIEQASSGVVAVALELEGERINPLHAQQGGGSGFLISPNEIITNFHVIALALEDNSVELKPGTAITVSFSGDPEQAHPVSVVGAMLDYDLALLRLQEPDVAPERQPIPFGNSDALQPGQKVIAIGNPFGLQFTVTSGIVSAIERQGESLFGIELPFIQTDAAVNPGNSGGPLLDSSGRLVGVNNAILSPSGAFAGVGFAVPVRLLEENLAQLRAGGLSGVIAQVADPDQPRIGIVSELSVSDYPEGIRQDMGLPEQGAVITGVVEGSPAERAGLRGPQGVLQLGSALLPTGVDVIMAIDGQPVNSVQDLQQVVVTKSQDETIRMVVWRDGERRQVSLRPEVLER